MQLEFDGKTYILDFKGAVKRVITKTLNFIADHQEEIVMSVPVFFAIGNAIHKTRVENRIENEYRRKTYSQWDPRSMHSWDLRRPLTNREKMILDERVRRGERMVDVLESMRVLR
jgi:hypothetical protein